MTAAPAFRRGDRVEWTPHHPALKKPEHPFRVTRVMPCATGDHGYWCAPDVPPKVCTLRNGRTVEDRQNWEMLVGESSLRMRDATVTP